VRGEREVRGEDAPVKRRSPRAISHAQARPGTPIFTEGFGVRVHVERLPDAYRLWPQPKTICRHVRRLKPNIMTTKQVMDAGIAAWNDYRDRGDSRQQQQIKN